MPGPAPRTITLLREPDDRGVGVFRIVAHGKTAFYTFREIPCEIGGRGFELHRLGVGNKYHVRVGHPRDCSCECKGYLFRHTCRHILGLKALIDAGFV
jgi:hypothetical protein